MKLLFKLFSSDSHLPIEMSTPYKLRNGADDDFGLSFMLMPFGKQRAISYGGGAATWRVNFPEKNLTVVELTNLQGSQPHALAGGIAALYDDRKK